MFVYILLYNVLARIMRVVELTKIGKIAPQHHFKIVHKYAYGAALFYYHVTGKVKGYNINETDDLNILNYEPDYNKIVVDKDQNLYATPISLLMLTHFQLINNNQIFYNPIQEKLLVHKTVRSNFTSLLTKEIFYIIMCLKKNKVPSPIIKLILFDLCKLYFKDADNYFCTTCNFLKYNGKCRSCTNCSFCFGESFLEYNCSEQGCKNLLCAECDSDKCTSCISDI